MVKKVRHLKRSRVTTFLKRWLSLVKPTLDIIFTPGTHTLFCRELSTPSTFPSHRVVSSWWCLFNQTIQILRSHFPSCTFKPHLVMKYLQRRPRNFSTPALTMVYSVLGCKMLQAVAYDEGCATLSFWTNPSVVPSSHSKISANAALRWSCDFFGHAILMLSTLTMPTCRNLRTPSGHSSREGYLHFCGRMLSQCSLTLSCKLSLW